VSVINSELKQKKCIVPITGSFNTFPWGHRANEKLSIGKADEDTRGTRDLVLLRLASGRKRSN